MKKHTFFPLLLMILALVIVPQVQAFSFQDSFSSFRQSLSHKLQRLYLGLPGSKSGEVVLEQMGLVMGKVETFTFSTQAGVVASDDQSQLLDAKLEVTGPTEANPASAKVTKQDLNAKIELNIQGTTLNADLDIKQNDRDIFVKINQAPFLPMLDLRQLSGKWYRLPTVEEAEDQDDLTNELEKLTLEQQKQVGERFYQLIKNSEVSQASKETRGEARVFVVTILVLDDEVASYLRDLENITRNEADEAPSEEDYQRLADFLTATSDLKFELWIDRQNYYLRHLSLPLTVNVKQLVEDQQAEEERPVVLLEDETEEVELGEAEGGEEIRESVAGQEPLMPTLDKVRQVELTLTVDFSKYNEPIEFEVPSGVEDFMEAYSALMMKSILGEEGEQPESGFFLKSPYYPEDPAELQDLTPSQKALLENLERQTKKPK